MVYQNEKAIYIRIAERICDDILSGHYAEGSRVPSVREIAAAYEVNPNTAMRAVEILQRDEVVYQQRGIGVFVAEGARRKILAARKEDFLRHDIPEFLRRLQLLGMGIEEVVKAWEQNQEVNKDLKK